jgi:adenylate cyclase
MNDGRPKPSSDKATAPVPPVAARPFDPSWLRALFLANARDSLSEPIQHILRRCELIRTEATLFRQEGFVPELHKIEEVATQLLALCNVAGAPLSPSGTSGAPVSMAAPVARRREAEPGGAVVAPVNAVEQRMLRNFSSECGSVLIVDDMPMVLESLVALLEENGHAVSTARTGAQALELVYTSTFDLIFLDLTLPDIDGLQVLQYLKGDMEWRHIPVIVVSGREDPESIVRCFELGADDFAFKPFNPVLLLARANTFIEKKRFREKELSYLNQIQIEQAKSERLLLNILPLSIANRLKQGEDTIVDKFPEVTVLFGDLVGFTQLSSRLTPEELVGSLNEIFSSFDRLAEQHGLEKIKTIGDAYMVVGGLPRPQANHATAIAEMALDMQGVIARYNAARQTHLSIRIGINTGPVVAGIIGKYKFIYDLWGDTVNTAHRMESHAPPDTVQVTEATYELLRGRYLFLERGAIDVKGKGDMYTFLLVSRLPV